MLVKNVQMTVREIPGLQPPLRAQLERLWTQETSGSPFSHRTGTFLGDRKCLCLEAMLARALTGKLQGSCRARDMSCCATKRLFIFQEC